MTNGSGKDRLSTGGAFDVLTKVVPDEDDRFIGREFGGYKISTLIAEGGMGRVYRGERVDGSFDRDVAIKLSLASRVSKDLRERFLREQQILADMSHPNVASLYDAGTTDEGWSFIIMELVEGQDIASYVDGMGLTERAVIELLLPLLDALAFAHSRLVVHRDIKASNIIVDRQGNARLLDFGIAKLLEDAASAATRARPLTVGAASPEQLLGKPITVASDIYQVGLLLHRLLLGEPALPDRTLAEAVANAAEERPFLLSHKASRELAPDLAAIVTHCLQPAPADRYRSMTALRDDLISFLAKRPVSVTPPTLTYRFAKLVQRNLLLALVLSVLLAVTIGGTALYTIRINDARLAAEREAATSEEVIIFLTEVFETSDPDTARGAELTARDLLDRGAARIDEQFPDRPIIRARLLHVIGGVYREMSLPNESLPLEKEAYELRLEHLGPNDRRTMMAGNDLAILYDRLERFDEAIEIYENVLDREREILGSDDPDTLKTLNNLGVAHLDRGDFAIAASYFEETLERRRRVLGADHADVGTTMRNLPIAYAGLGDLERAREAFIEALDYSRRVTGEDSPGTITALINAGSVSYNTGRYEEGVAYTKQAWELARNVLGEQHYGTLVVGLNRADNLTSRPDVEASAADIDAAKAILEGVRDTAIEVFGDEHSLALAARVRLGSIQNFNGQHTEALEALESVLETQSAMSNADYLDAVETRKRIAETLVFLGRTGESVAEYAAINADLEERYGRDYPLRLQLLRDQAEAHIALGELDRAEALYRESADRLVASLGESAPKAAEAVAELDVFLVEHRGEANRTGTP